MARLAADTLRTYRVPSHTDPFASHTVSVVASQRAGLAGPAGTLYLSCDCKGGRMFWATGRPCHAMRTIAERTGISIPTIRR